MFNLQGYTAHELLSQNEHFTVLRAIHDNTAQPLTFKLCSAEHPSPEELRSLKHEYQILKQLNLPQVIKAYDLIKHHHQLVLILEDMRGITLRQYLTEHPLSLTDFFSIAFQLVEALQGLELQNIIYKNLNPSNILVEPSTLTTKLIDFSIASQLTQEITASTPEQLEGTLAYLAPEQTGRMNAKVDYRADFYSLGVTFYEMLTNTLPFQADDPLELIYSHLAKTAVPVHERNPHLPPMIAAIVAKLMAKLPEERYISAAGLKTDLLECQHQWLTHQTIPSFTLGQHDFSEHLALSQKLYGREDDIKTLLTAFERINQDQAEQHTSAEMLLVSGYSGIGKTSLIKELYKPITQRHGYFISGKYDQLRHTTPYSAIIEAFQELTHRLLAEPQEKLLQLKNDLLTALGPNAQALIAVIPNLALLLSEQPPIPDLPPEQSQNRFMLTFQAFVCTLARPAHPLVLFLDDLQWADSASLQLLSQIMLNPKLRHFLFIGAYRNNEVSKEHPLSLTLQALLKSGVIINTLLLTPLKQSAVTQLLADSLNCTHEQTGALAALILNKTQGNPFFINEFIKLLYQQKLLNFSAEKNCWEWEITRIEEQTITDNVVELLITRLRELPDKAQKVLSLAACMGHNFDLQTLAIISEQSVIDTAHQLWPAVKAQFIKPLNDAYQLLQTLEEETEIDTDINTLNIRYQFTHDRIQQSAYLLIEESIRQATHLQIGRLLLKENPLQEQDIRLFDILNHFNHSLQQITDPDERLQLARYNLWASNKAKLSTAYQIALEYAQAGLSLLPEAAWEQEHELSFALYKALGECTYLSGHSEEAEKIVQVLLQQARNFSEKLSIYTLKIMILSTNSQYKEALALGLEVLRTLGINIKLPKKIRNWHILKAMLALEWRIGFKDITKLNLSPMQRQEYLESDDLLLIHMVNAAYNIDHKLAVLLMYKVAVINFKYGYTPNFVTIGISNIAVVMLHIANRYEKAFAFLALGEKLRSQVSAFQTALLAKQKLSLLTQSLFFTPYKYPIAVCLEDTNKAYQSCLEGGDLNYAAMSLSASTIILWILGRPLTEVSQALQNVQSFQTTNKILVLKDLIQIRLRYVRFLLGKSDESLEKLINVSELAKPLESQVQTCAVYINGALLAYLYGNFTEALKIFQLNESNLQYVKGLINYPQNQFLHALTLAACYDNAPRQEQYQQKKKLKTLYKQLKRWAKWCAVNFLPYETLIAAELARISGHNFKAADSYDQAIEAAHTSENLYVLGLANECAGRFYLTLKKPHMAKVYLQNAHSAFAQWGALVKCRLLEQSYPEFIQATAQQTAGLITDQTLASTETSLAAIDVLSILKSAQNISSEIQLDKLLQKLLCILLENAEAQRGLLIMKEPNGWFVKAEGTIAAQQITLTQNKPLEERQDIPLSLFQYAQRSNTQVIIQTPQDFERYYASDPYLEQIQPQSILLLPIFYQNELAYLVYLENRDTSGAFTQECIQTLQLLASQAAISLENARLYYQATHDALTGLANRNLLYYLFQRTVHQAKRDDTQIAILLFDLDGFKKINDTLGHEAGDKLLLYFTEQLKYCIQDTDLAARLGNDEFVVMLEGITSAAEVRAFAEYFLQQLKVPATIAGQTINIATSIGISMYPQDGTDIQTLLKQADNALYQVKSSSKNNYQFYTSQLRFQPQKRKVQIEDLQQALEKGEFRLHYQPVFNREQQLMYFEALIRWQHPVHGLLTAEEFIGLTEQTGLILPIGEWVLTTACKQLQAWESNPAITPVPIAVNISGLQVKRQKFSLLVTRLLKETGINPKYLELELTESMFIEQSQATLDDIATLKTLGVRLTLDDFGTYYSSFMYLKHFQISKIKIDRSFVRDVLSNNTDKVIINSIITLAQGLKIPVIAEGIETEEQLQFLITQGADGIQGYYLGKPKAIEEYLHLLEKKV